MKRVSAILLGVGIFILIICVLYTPKNQALEQIVVQNVIYSAAAVADRAVPDDDGIGGTVLSVVSDEEGTRMMSFLRLPLPYGVTASQVENAYLQLYCKDVTKAQAEVGAVAKSWYMQQASWNYMVDGVSFQTASQGVAIGNDWYQFDVTEIIKLWLSGETANYGFAIAPTVINHSIEFASPFDEDTSKVPRLVIDYHPENSNAIYGKYEYVQQTEGNCLSYALRDTTPIYLDRLTFDTGAFEEAIEAGEGVAYFTQLVLDYVEQNKSGLEISGIRTVSVEEAIDVENEYKVVMRLGFHNRNGIEGIQVADGDFDYHLRFQLKDGSWTEKFPQDVSRFVPGTNRENSLNQFPWDSSYMMGYMKWHEYYDSAPVYFAVTKTSDEFTAH